MHPVCDLNLLRLAVPDATPPPPRTRHQLRRATHTQTEKPPRTAIPFVAASIRELRQIDGDGSLTGLCRLSAFPETAVSSAARAFLSELCGRSLRTLRLTPFSVLGTRNSLLPYNLVSSRSHCLAYNDLRDW